MQINAKTKDVVWNYLGIFFFARVTGHLAAGLDPLSAARYSGTLVCVCQHWRSSGPYG